MLMMVLRLGEWMRRLVLGIVISCNLWLYVTYEGKYCDVKLYGDVVLSRVKVKIVE